MSTPKEATNNGSSDAAAPRPQSTLSILKQKRTDSNGFLKFYAKVWNHISGVKPTYGILDYPMRFLLSLVMITVGSIFMNDCQAEPMVPIFLVVTGVVNLSIQIIEQTAASLLKDDNEAWKIAIEICTSLMWVFLFIWFLTGGIFVNLMSIPTMTQIPTSPSLNITDLVMSLTNTNSALTTDQLALVNKTMTALFSPEKHCAFPVYSLATIIIILPGLNFGIFVITTVTAIVLYCTSH